jgi:hypothetical protein
MHRIGRHLPDQCRVGATHQTQRLFPWLVTPTLQRAATVFCDDPDRLLSRHGGQPPFLPVPERRRPDPDSAQSVPGGSSTRTQDVPGPYPRGTQAVPRPYPGRTQMYPVQLPWVRPWKSCNSFLNIQLCGLLRPTVCPEGEQSKQTRHVILQEVATKTRLAADFQNFEKRTQTYPVRPLKGRKTRHLARRTGSRQSWTPLAIPGRPL